MKRIGLVIVCALAALAPLFFLGCEAESTADLQLDLIPRSATLSNGQSAVFTVYGGFDYRWSLSDDTIGNLNIRTGNQVIYTDTSTNSGTQYLTVQSYIIGASGSAPTNVVSTNQPSTSATITATIKQLGS